MTRLISNTVIPFLIMPSHYSVVDLMVSMTSRIEHRYLGRNAGGLLISSPEASREGGMEG